jgi:hypothetical protein
MILSASAYRVQKSDLDDSVEGTEKAMYPRDYVMSVHDGALGIINLCGKHNKSDIGRYNIIDIISYHYITFSSILIFLYHFLKGDIFVI